MTADASIQDDDFEYDNDPQYDQLETSPSVNDQQRALDARRRIEEKLEEERLRKELSDFDDF